MNVCVLAFTDFKTICTSKKELPFPIGDALPFPIENDLPFPI